MAFWNKRSEAKYKVDDLVRVPGYNLSNGIVRSMTYDRTYQCWTYTVEYEFSNGEYRTGLYNDKLLSDPDPSLNYIHNKTRSQNAGKIPVQYTNNPPVEIDVVEPSELIKLLSFSARYAVSQDEYEDNTVYARVTDSITGTTYTASITINFEEERNDQVSQEASRS